MKVTVLGATGNIGTSVVERFARAGDLEVTGVARRAPEPGAARSPGGHPVRWRAADVRDVDWPDLLGEAEAVVCLAWMFQPARRPEVTWQTNVVALDRMLRALPATRVEHVVVASSVAAYSPRATDDPVDERWETHGASAATYAREKAYVERLLDRVEEAGVRVARVRPAFVFQRRSASEQRRIFAGRQLPAALARPRLAPVVPVPRGLRLQAVHAADVAEATHAVVSRRASGAFNLCADDVLGAEELARLLGARPVEVPAGAVRAAMTAAWAARLSPSDPRLLDALLRVPVMSSARARDELGWRPSRSAADTLGELLDGLEDRAGHGTAPLAPG